MKNELLEKLKFRAEDFLSDDELNKHAREIFPEWKDIITSLALHHAIQGNALLAERLGNIRKYLFSYHSDCEQVICVKGDCGEEGATHTGFLVAIEEIKK